jgi:hypothetical protein
MARRHYQVGPNGLGGWKVSLDGTSLGNHHTQRLAINTAIGFAHADGRNGHDAQVRVQGADGQYRTEWTYGHDPYPPKG